ncbi:MAG: hypothetical protein NC120_12100 [Ruminococcus sp.]|nr:hypothetical protein [Ruminococcus sp.]
MRKTAALAAFTAVFLSACAASPAEGLNEEIDIIDDDLSLTGAWNADAENPGADSASGGVWTTENRTDSTEPAPPDTGGGLLGEIEGHIALFEYGKAVRLIEENRDICADPAYDGVKDELMIHFTGIAESYYRSAASFFTKQEVSGADVQAMFDENGNMPGSRLEELLTEEEKTVMNRAVISRGTAADYIMSFGVSIEIFGEYAVYPVQDIMLEETTAVTGEYTDSAELLAAVRKNIDLYRYAAAVRLMEENPEAADDISFYDTRTELTEYFSAKAKLFYTNTMVYVTKQEILGRSLDSGCEGYDTETHTLDPAYLSELCSPAETAVMKRVKIVCNNEANWDFRVTVGFCGMTVSYPAEDIML